MGLTILSTPPPDSIAFADRSARSALAEAERWIEEAARRRGTAPNLQEQRRALRVIALRIAEAQILLPD